MTPHDKDYRMTRDDEAVRSTQHSSLWMSLLYLTLNRITRKKEKEKKKKKNQQNKKQKEKDDEDA